MGEIVRCSSDSARASCCNGTCILILISAFPVNSGTGGRSGGLRDFAGDRAREFRAEHQQTYAPSPGECVLMGFCLQPAPSLPRPFCLSVLSLNQQYLARPRMPGWCPAKYLRAIESAQQHWEGPIVNSGNRGAYRHYRNDSRDRHVVRIMHDANVRPAIIPIRNDVRRNVRQGVGLREATQSKGGRHHRGKKPNVQFRRHLAPFIGCNRPKLLLLRGVRNIMTDACSLERQSRLTVHVIGYFRCEAERDGVHSKRNGHTHAPPADR